MLIKLDGYFYDAFRKNLPDAIKFYIKLLNIWFRSFLLYNSANMFSISLGVEQTSGGDIPIRLRYGGNLLSQVS